MLLSFDHFGCSNIVFSLSKGWELLQTMDPAHEKCVHVSDHWLADPEGVWIITLLSDCPLPLDRETLSSNPPLLQRERERESSSSTPFAQFFPYLICIIEYIVSCFYFWAPESTFKASLASLLSSSTPEPFDIDKGPNHVLTTKAYIIGSSMLHGFVLYCWLYMPCSLYLSPT